MYACVCYLQIYKYFIIPDMPNIHNIFAIIGHRFGHQSRLDESSRQKTTISLHQNASRAFLVFFKNT